MCTSVAFNTTTECAAQIAIDRLVRDFFSFSATTNENRFSSFVFR